MDNSSGKSIFIIEDDSDLRNSLTQVLLFEGYTVIDAGDKSDGLTRLCCRKPDLLIFEFLWFDDDAFETLKRIKESHCADVPFLMITHSPDIREYCRLAGELADCLLIKPFYLSELLHCIRYLLKETDQVIPKCIKNISGE